MTLLNGLLALGAAAFTIPLLIHLLHRSRFQIVDWGAMQFLKSTSKLNSRRLQWRQWLLLLLRCAIPVLLALAMARPLIHSLWSADGQSPIAIAIILDDSMSMFATERSEAGENPKTRFAIACQSAAELCKHLPFESNALVVFAGTKPELLSEPILDDLASKLRDIGKRTTPAGDLALQEAVGSAVQWLGASQHSRRQVVIISDFQKHDWSQSATGFMSEIANQFASQSIPPTLSLMRVGSNSENPMNPISNLSVDAIDVLPSQLALDSDATISVKVANHSHSRSELVQVALMVDGSEIDRQSINLDVDSSTQIRARWTPSRIGEHLVRAQIFFQDSLSWDNDLSAVAVVQNPLPVLLVDGDIKQESMQSEADFLRIALSPYSLLGGKKGDVFSSKTIPPEQLTESQLIGYRAVCLCNVSQVSEEQQRWLRRFVEQGNGLIVFLGDKANGEHYQQWPTVPNGGLRIAKFSPREKTRADSPTLDVSPADVGWSPESRLQLQQFDFSPLRDLSSASSKSLSSVRFEYRTPIQLDVEFGDAGGDLTGHASVAMRFEDGQPWMLESRVGKGRCLWIASACDDDDSNLPTRSIFVPLVQKLTAYVCNPEPLGSNLHVGAPWTVAMGEANTPSNELDPQVVLTKPDGSKSYSQWKTGERLHFSDTRLLGKYEAKRQPQLAPTSSQENADSSGGSHWIACVGVNDHRDGQESNLLELNADELKSLATICNATVANGGKDLLRQTLADWHGREVWTWFWSILIICFLAEMATAQSLSPHRKPRAASLLQKFRGASR